MKITKKKPVKETVKAKAKAVKQKVKGKVKGCAALVALAFAAVALSGCQTPNQASRGTSNENGDFEPSVDVKVNGSSNIVSVVIRNSYGDGAIASADSSGSTESQTQTPTFDISPKTDLRYNDAIGAGGNAVSSFVSSLTSEGFAALRDYVVNKKSGKITVTKKDGTTETLDCVDGNCTTTGGLKINAENCENCVVK
jgi:hypothetical protein